MDGGLLDLHVGALIVFSASLERPLPIPTADSSNSSPVCQSRWVSYDRAFRQHAAATNLVDWSSINVQLFNFHAAGSSVRRRNYVPSGSSEPSGSSTSRIVCRSCKRGHCSAPGAACRFAHRCSRCSGVHRASSCPGLSSDKSQADSKRREPSPESVRSRSKSRRV